MGTKQEELDEGIAQILQEPERNFQTHPLNQSEVTGLIEYLVNQINDEKTAEPLAQFYLSVVTFLKTQVLYN